MQDVETEPNRQPPRDLILQLRRPPFWSPGFKSLIFLLSFLVVGYWLMVGQVLASSPVRVSLWDYLLAFVPPLLIPLLLFGLRRRRRRRELLPMHFAADKVRLPVSLESNRTATLAYQEISGIDIRGHGATTRLFISTRDRLYVLPRFCFVDPAGLEMAVQSLHGRILAQPSGPRLIERMGRQRELLAAAMTNRPRVTHALLGLVVVVFLLEYMTGALSESGYFGLVPFGANVPLLVRDGEIFRLASATFLHAGIAHFYLNALALYYLGGILERLFGWARFAVVYGIAGLVGSLGTVMADQAVSSVGASGAIFGLLGALAVVNWRFRQQLPLGFRQPWRWWLFIGGINILLPLWFPRIDVMAHGAGFVAGALVAFLVLDAEKRVDPKKKPPVTITVLAIFIAFFYMASLATGLQRGMDADHNDRIRFAKVVLTTPSSRPELLAATAYHLATDKRARNPDLQVARSAILRVLNAQPQQILAAETLALIEHRLGDTEAAIQHQAQLLDAALAVEETKRPAGLWTRLLRLGPESKQATRLGEFLVGRLNASGPLATNLPEGVDVSLSLEAPNASGERRLLVRIEGEHEGLRIVGVARRQEKDSQNYVALVHILVGAGRGGVLAVTPDDVDHSTWPGIDNVALAWVDGDGCAQCEPQKQALRLWYQDIRVAPLE